MVNRNPEASEELKPYESGVCFDFASVLASRDPTLIQSILGLSAVHPISRERTDTVAGDWLGRGNRGTDGHANTNKSYWPRQLNFFEFLMENPDLQTSVEDLAKEMNIDRQVAIDRLRWKEGKLMLATPEACIAYLEHKRGQREELVDYRRQFLQIAC